MSIGQTRLARTPTPEKRDSEKHKEEIWNSYKINKTLEEKWVYE
jgi:hypothetical protein